ncbi:hypothetical protein QNO07_06075 [Streptomyces sp. 549]|uniref:hypothetical protein n=1 Tax=Streptomyces sp. 549 TaxID=3049076 RepID=UPI0024C4442E|nr:hypothetical protein [Streptomyces sp. 549]MDK1473000.1 hypothetical protein [Streptomyces sp. 549]
MSGEPGDGTLAALGFAGAPLVEPLRYPGRVAEQPVLLSGGRLRPLRGFPVTGRVPVLAVGSNGSPAQLHHKLTGAGVTDTVPLAPVRVEGLAVALSGHVSRAGYVAATPYRAPGEAVALVLTWLTPEQLAVVDVSESVNYRRVALPPADFPVLLPDGTPTAQGGAQLYVSLRGVLTDPAGRPRPRGPQEAVLSALLADSARLRVLFGPTPRTWMAAVRDDPSLPARGTAVFRSEGWVRESGGLLDLLPPGQPADAGPSAGSEAPQPARSTAARHVPRR